MRRVPFIVVIVALLATPLALLGRAMSCESANCAMMCCLPHAQSHGATSAPCHCSSKSRKLPDFGLIAPIAPTVTEAFASIEQPAAIRLAAQSASHLSLQGFQSAPFNPPKS
jgi:hypothetical protein